MNSGSTRGRRATCDHVILTFDLSISKKFKLHGTRATFPPMFLLSIEFRCWVTGSHGHTDRRTDGKMDRVQCLMSHPG